jgi:hypothetical protein
VVKECSVVDKLHYNCKVGCHRAHPLEHHNVLVHQAGVDRRLPRVVVRTCVRVGACVSMCSRWKRMRMRMGGGGEAACSSTSTSSSPRPTAPHALDQSVARRSRSTSSQQRFRRRPQAPVDARARRARTLHAQCTRASPALLWESTMQQTRRASDCSQPLRRSQPQHHHRPQCRTSRPPRLRRHPHSRPSAGGGVLRHAVVMTRMGDSARQQRQKRKQCETHRGGHRCLTPLPSWLHHHRAGSMCRRHLPRPPTLLEAGVTTGATMLAA